MELLGRVVVLGVIEQLLRRVHQRRGGQRSDKIEGKTSIFYVMSFESWFERSVGEWVSDRRYLYGSQRVSDSLSVEFSLRREGESEFTLVWSSERNEGEMGFIIKGDVLERSRSYYKEEGCETRMERVDEDCVVFWSAYDGMKFREEIRLVDGGRLRQTVGWKKGEIVLVGSYFEERV